MLTRRILISTGLAVPAAILVTPAFAAKPPIYAENGIAINGFDAVAYFTEGQPVKGDPGISSDWQGAKLLFASADNKAMYDADPLKYSPRYGGYCAYAVSKGATAPTDPQAFTVHDDRLYLNYSLDVRSIWRQDIPGNIQRADANWPGVLA